MSCAAVLPCAVWGCAGHFVRVRLLPARVAVDVGVGWGGEGDEESNHRVHRDSVQRGVEFGGEAGLPQLRPRRHRG